MKLKAIYLEWDDAEFTDPGWNAYNQTTKRTVVKTTAWLIAETDKDIIISHSCDPQPRLTQWADQFAIPKSAIRKRRWVRMP